MNVLWIVIISLIGSTVRIKILKYFIAEWKNGHINKREHIVKALIHSVNANVDENGTGTIKIQYIADKQLEKDWHKIRKCEPGKDQVRTLASIGSPRVTAMRTIFTAKMPLRAVNQGPNGIDYQIHYRKLAEKYPNWSNANHYKTVNSVNRKPKKKKKSKEEQREIFEQLLASGEVDTQADIARKFNCSRAWVSKVLS
ncbi:hypothetical protein [Fodinibius sediminis]|uniref:Uncharacterized protein n=1 Tax=Fodinibius sediminis TaxID=1214077 RepID=A0A521CXY3_9BACT|nr:hypothetical protein [Fodinibius sediminis]SMO64326.1 hypothetical protein SAMN06265218_1083 [Fodinibius sediminis]